jgi:hypothetical protein
MPKAAQLHGSRYIRAAVPNWRPVGSRLRKRLLGGRAGWNSGLSEGEHHGQIGEQHQHDRRRTV